MNNSIEVGMTVAVLDDTIKGVVKEVNDTNVTIESDGFLLTYNSAELVLIKEDQKDFSKYIDIHHDALIEKEEPTHQRKSKKHLKIKDIPPLEVDLHINQLVKSSKRMSNHEMLTLQVETAKRQLEFAISKKIPRVVFIHGVGEGVLKKELEYLFRRYHLKVSDASFQKYGFGATEVYFYQNK